MVTDYYGNEIKVGDVVTEVGSSGEFVVTKIGSFLGFGETLEMQGRNWQATRVNPKNVIVK